MSVSLATLEKWRAFKVNDPENFIGFSSPSLSHPFLSVAEKKRKSERERMRLVSARAFSFVWPSFFTFPKRFLFFETAKVKERKKPVSKKAFWHWLLIWSLKRPPQGN